jgi:hypothetical protein
VAQAARSRGPLTATDERLWVRIEQILECARFQPPRVGDFARMLGSREEEVRRLLWRLALMGRLIEERTATFLPGSALSNWRQPYVFSPSAVRTARSPRRLTAIASVPDENLRYRSSSSSTEPA